jgi:uncharacterized repeat protein (TIGR01451 family)
MNRVRLVRGRRSLLLGAFVLVVGFTSNGFAQNADLNISKNASSSDVLADSDVTYEIGVGNFSDQTSTPTNTVTDTVPANMTFVSALFPDGWNCVTPSAGGTGMISCTYDSPIATEQSFQFTFVFHVNSGVPNGTIINNTATISHAGSDSNSMNNSSTAAVTVGTPPPPPLAAHEVLISEFRLSGPGGNSDEFIEFYCNRDTDCDLGSSSIRAYDPLNRGTEIDPSFGDFSYTFPPNTIIPARHYLLVATVGQYSLGTYASPDFNVNNAMFPDFFIDNEGIQLIGADEPIVLDSVGFIGGGNDGQYIEGTGLQRATSARPADQYAYVRKRTIETNGLPQDTDNNANDFVLVSVTGAPHPGITAPPVLGAPGPQGRNSPRSYSNTQFPSSLVEPSVDKALPPNRVRVGVGDSGTLSIRRTVTNNTNQSFNYLRFRVIEITTLNSPNPFSGQSELRLITSPEAASFINTEPRSVVIKGTILEYDSGTEPVQPNGGGLNSTVYADLGEDGPVLPGETLDVQFLLNVVRAGLYQFYVYVEGVPGPVGDGPATNTPLQMINLKRGTKPSAPGTKKPKQVKVFTPPATPTAMSTPAATPVRVWIMPRALEPRAKTRKKKLRLRRKASTAVPAKAEAKAGDEKTPQN